ncbi:hypothetical protein [Brevibacillus laterosporus]|uniref:hypothetical protein n=1 Tax=Brevibacillus laterosporus TaxID=1465 RepID=UPI0020D0610E|nr:hypothetical protein [Brevibacillus laterosporus]
MQATLQGEHFRSIGIAAVSFKNISPAAKNLLISSLNGLIYYNKNKGCQRFFKSESLMGVLRTEPCFFFFFFLKESKHFVKLTVS